MKIALIGNQNCGKSTLFNTLTGSNQKVGNWPGVTVEKKAGIIKGTKHDIIDLPGIYSLSPYTKEEEISRHFILKEKPDVIINIVDATSLERSLYLTTQLMELDCKLIVALNMCDLLDKKELFIDEKKLSSLLDVSVVKISALKKTGVEDLIKELENTKKKNNKKIYENFLENTIKNVEKNISCTNKRFFSIKCLEKDQLFDATLIKKNKTDIEKEINNLEEHYKTDGEEIFASERYKFIENIKSKVLVQKNKKTTLTDKLDKIFLNKWLAIPIFVLIMGGIYFLSVGVVGSWTVDFIGSVINSFSNWVASGLETLGASEWSISLLCDGIFAGVGAVLNFVPQLILLFTCISLLETTGYMSRISFFFDKIFKRFGLSGKTLIPFIVGSGCSVPAIMTTRTIEDENEKRTTIMLTPFIPCSAKLPIIALFGSFFFSNSWLVTTSLYLFAIATIIISAIIIRKFFLKGSSTSYISELPEYKAPSFNYVARDVFEKSFAFIKKAGTIILLCSVVVWFLLSFNWRFQYGVDVENSMMAGIGSVFSWFFYPILGNLNWAATVSAIQGLIAKEQVVSSMAIIAGISEGAQTSLIFSAGGPFSFFTPVSAFAFMVFNLFSAPCFGAIAAMHKELGSTKKTLITVTFQTFIAWVLASLSFLIGSLIVMLL